MQEEWDVQVLLFCSNVQALIFEFSIIDRTFSTHLFSHPIYILFFPLLMLFIFSHLISLYFILSIFFYVFL